MGKNAVFILIVSLIILCVLPVLHVNAQLEQEFSTLGTVRIMPDGTIEGTDKFQVNGNVYTLTGDIYCELGDPFGMMPSFLVILKDDVVVDGAGYTLQGNGTGIGIYLRGVQDVVVTNFNIKNFNLGISTYVTEGLLPMKFLMRATCNNHFIDNNIDVVDTGSILTGSRGGWGIYVEFANNTLIKGNTITSKTLRKASSSAPGSEAVLT